MDMVIADLKEPRFSAVTEQYYRDEYLQGEVYVGSEVEIVDYEELSEKAEEVEQADLEAKQAEFRENNPDVQISGQRQKNCFIVWTDRAQRI